MLWKRVVVGDQERVLIAKNGRFNGILESGQHRIFVSPGVFLETEKHNMRDLVFGSKWADYLVKERSDLVNRYFTCVETSDVQVAMVYVDSKLLEVLLPAKRVLYWRGLAEVTAEVIDVVAQPEIPASKLPALERLGRNSHATLSVVEEAKTGLLFIDNRLVRTLPPGKYGFWAVTGSPRVEMNAIGVEVGTAALKDIILPGDMREIMNQVVSAEKQAQANLIRRREETAATRSLLNTAKRLEDNPILVRLKELDTLEKLVEKVDRLTVTGGFEGLLDNFIELLRLA